MTLVEDLLSSTETGLELDLVDALQQLFEHSSEPLTLARIRQALPTADADTLEETLERQVAAHVFYVYPRYRGPQPRYWHQPMRVHLEYLLRAALRAGPLSWNDIRRKLPDYAKMLTESVLEQLLIKGVFFRHPPRSTRMGPRYGLKPPDVRQYLRPEVEGLLAKMKGLGFSKEQVRAGMVDIFGIVSRD